MLRDRLFIGRLALAWALSMLLCLALSPGPARAQTMAFALGKPFVGINHHEAHLYSPWIGGEPRSESVV